MAAYVSLQDQEEHGNIALEPGDILCKYFYAKDPVSHAIRLGQFFKQKRHANVVHAAIAYDAEHVIEASGAGVVMNEISANLKAGYVYRVFRYKDSEVAQEAAQIAHSKIGKQYAAKKAFASLGKGGGHTKEEDEVNLMGSKRLFCSELAVACYNENASERKAEIIAYEAQSANPAALIGLLKASPDWKNLGKLRK